MVSRRRFLAKYPAPPPTPDGYVWATKVRYGFDGVTVIGKRTVLVKAEELQAACKQELGHLDELDPAARKTAYETGKVPEKQVARDNVRLARLGFGRAT